MSKAAELAALIGGQKALGDKNLIINGSMTVAQRGTSGTSTADIYTVDRFAIGHGSPVNAMTFEQSTDAPNNFKNSIKVTAGTGASASTTGYALLRQAIEGQNIAHIGFGTSAAKAIILSFYVKSSLTGTFGVSMRNQAGTRAYGGTYAISSANTWEYVTVAFPADTGGTWPTDTGIGFHMQWDLGAGSNYDIAAGSWTDGTNMFGVEGTVKLTETTNATWQMTGVQLEIGDVATPFEHRSFGDELAKCQRYYYKADMNGVGSSWHPNSLAAGTGYLIEKVYYPVAMRANPTGTTTATSGSTFSGSAPYMSVTTTTFAAARYDVTVTSNGYASITSFILDAEL